MMRQVFTVVSAAAVLGMIGCTGPRQSILLPPPIMPAPDRETVMAAARETLGQMQFVIDKYDVDAGYIRTRPLRAGQFFEPWRQDNASSRAFAQANLDSLRRTVEIFVEPQNGTLWMRCVVNVEKLSLPPQPIVSMSMLARMYTDSNTRTQTLVPGEQVAEQMEWVDLGPDYALEHRILNKIDRQIQRSKAAALDRLG